MGDLIFILIIFALGFWIGRKTAPKQEQITHKNRQGGFWIQRKATIESYV